MRGMPLHLDQCYPNFLTDKLLIIRYGEFEALKYLGHNSRESAREKLFHFSLLF